MGPKAQHLRSEGFNINIFYPFKKHASFIMEIWFDHFHQSINSRNEIEPTEIAEYKL